MSTQALQIIKYSVTCLALIYSLISTIIIVVKSKKSNKNTTNVDIGEILYKQIMDSMEIAENTYNAIKSVANIDVSKLKLSDVISKVQNYCLINGIAYDERDIVERIERLISFSKSVNFHN